MKKRRPFGRLFGGRVLLFVYYKNISFSPSFLLYLEKSKSGTYGLPGKPGSFTISKP